MLSSTCQDYPGCSESEADVTINQGQRRLRRRSLSVRAGVAFPVRKILRKMKKRMLLRIWIVAAVYMAAVIEYVVSETLDLSGSLTKSENKKIIKPRHINAALKYDQELKKLTESAILPEVTKILPTLKK